MEAELSSCNSMGCTSQVDAQSVISNSNPLADLHKVTKMGANLDIEIRNGKRVAPSLELKGQFAMRN